MLLIWRRLVDTSSEPVKNLLFLVGGASVHAAFTMSINLFYDKNPVKRDFSLILHCRKSAYIGVSSRDRGVTADGEDGC